MRNRNNINTVIETMFQFSCRNNHRRQIHRNLSFAVDVRQRLSIRRIPRRMLSSSRVGAASNFHTKTSFSSQLRIIQSDLFCNYYCSGRRFTTTSSTTTSTTGGDDNMPKEQHQPIHQEKRSRKYPKWITDLDVSKPMDARRAFKYLQLEHYDKDELKNRFHQIMIAGYAADNDVTNIVEPSASSSGADDKLADTAADPITTAEVLHTKIVGVEDIQSHTKILSETQLRSYLEKAISEFEAKNMEYGYSNQSASEPQVPSFSELRSEFIDRETHRLSNFLMLGSSEENGLGTGILTNLVGDFRRRSGQKDQHIQLEMSQDDFIRSVQQQASSIDIRRLWPLTVSMIMVGSTVGVTTPAMPFVVQQLGITTAEYGWVVSAFALSKMTGNIPFAVLVERFGRKPYLVYSMVVISAGVGGIGLATGFESLYLCRLLTGFGVAALSTAATLTVTDISTPLNRASTFAPIMSGFAAGTAIGPAFGGILVDAVGTTETFYMVGLSYIALAGMNTMLLDETKPTKVVKLPWQIISNNSSSDKKSVNNGKEDPSSIRVAFQKALGQWIPLLSQAPVRNVCIMNAFYWVALAGSQMTLLPLILTNPDGLNMTATQVGQVYMGMSTVQVFGGPVFAKFVDHVGKVPGIVGGCSLISASMAALPMCDGSIEQMAGVLALWATGSTLLSTSPLAYVSDQVEDDERAQAIALLRTSGDVGFLIGASSMGALADWAGSLEMAMQSSSAILLTATGWFTARSLLTAQLAKSSSP
eukprot:CAMPEP_0113449354 /NCGR_PEP_ID=MMETSP0014_2-20120614/5253_1 /TAXON_ID=2857 /ORGANISM="Nitzschia sp." /LENGTH=758 /DNA_ID=CAMNT_0000340623 /DNA_START=96 /DNA_END=2375 /DNA_ORIENTATION=- /assembly_acc=CAM_ASM_000159